MFANSRECENYNLQKGQFVERAAESKKIKIILYDIFFLFSYILLEERQETYLAQVTAHNEEIEVPNLRKYDDNGLVYTFMDKETVCC